MRLGERPASRFDAEHQRGRPHRKTRTRGANVAIRIVIFEFGRDGLRAIAGRYFAHAKTPPAVIIQRRAHGVQDLRVMGVGCVRLGAPGLFGLISDAFKHIAIHEIDIEVIRLCHRARFDQASHNHRQAGRNASRQVSNLRIDSEFGACNAGRRRPGDGRAEQGHAVRFNSKLAERRPRLCGRGLNVIRPLFRISRNLPSGFGTRGRGFIRGRHRVFDIGAPMAHSDFQFRAGRRREACARVVAQHMLHMYGLAGSEQGAIEHRGREFGSLWLGARQMKLPVGDSFVPLGGDHADVIPEARARDQPFRIPLTSRQISGPR